MKKSGEGVMEYDNDQMCFVCGKRNGDGLQLDFELVGEGGIRTEFTPPKRYQGWKDIVHGGIIATILDEVMVNAAYLRKIVAVSAKLEIKLRMPAAVGERLIFHGQILGINPEAVIVDLCHGTTAHDPSEAAFLLATSYRYFPKGTIHVAVVDPGVGGPRRAILATCDGHLFVGPDNGLLGPIAERGGPSSVRAITAERYFLQPVSATFHGRDIFAPVAGHLSLGAEPDRFGHPIDDYVRLTLPRPSQSGASSIKGEILHVDRFGNLVSNIAREDLEPLASGGPITALQVEIAGRTLPIVG